MKLKVGMTVKTDDTNRAVVTAISSQHIIVQDPDGQEYAYAYAGTVVGGGLEVPITEFEQSISDPLPTGEHSVADQPEENSEEEGETLDEVCRQVFPSDSDDERERAYEAVLYGRDQRISKLNARVHELESFVREFQQYCSSYIKLSDRSVTAIGRLYQKADVIMQASKDGGDADNA